MARGRYSRLLKQYNREVHLTDMPSIFGVLYTGKSFFTEKRQQQKNTAVQA